MRPEAVSEAQRGHRFLTGDWVVLVAVVAFIAGTFLPFQSLRVTHGLTTTLYDQIVVGSSGLVERIGGYLVLYAGALTAGTVALIGFKLHDRRWAAPALAATVAAWSLAWVGVLLSTLALSSWALLFGYWWVMASLVLAMVGAMIALRRWMSTKDC